MTTEDDFNAALDACPEDWQTRLVFADWLQERGDPRAEGYRAIASNRFVFCDQAARGKGAFSWIPLEPSTIFESGYDDTGDPSDIPSDWFDELVGGELRERGPWGGGSVQYPNRRAAEDAAALAFAELPAERRAELLRNIPLENLHSGVANSLTSGVG